MREIKFRGKSIDNGEWVYGGIHFHESIKLGCCTKEQFEENKETFIVVDGMADFGLSVPVHLIKVDPKTVGQFTGLKDKNGVEIYEGDILDGGFIVTFYNGSFGFWSKENSIPEFFMLYRYLNHKKVIGNIYSNPELLESKEHKL